jgi:hypothetical protein
MLNYNTSPFIRQTWSWRLVKANLTKAPIWFMINPASDVILPQESLLKHFKKEDEDVTKR